MTDKLLFTLYNFFVVYPLYFLLMILSRFNQKIKLGKTGRERLFEDLILHFASVPKNKKRIWVHSSSLGEFEQAKPIIEELRKNRNYHIMVTFFSPSGYMNSRKYPYADYISYIPFDTAFNAQRFITLAYPDLAIFMRYDLWPNHINELWKNKIPTFLVDATLRKDTSRKMFISKQFHTILYSRLTAILTVSGDDAVNFSSFGCKEIKVVGDTRFDRVYEKSLKAKERNLLSEEITRNKKIFVVGSSWQEDEEVLIPSIIKLLKYDKDVLIIIAPHEPTVEHLEKLENDFAGIHPTIRFSFLNDYKSERVIIVDSIGILLTLYYYCDAAFIGGSFKSSIHNILEAAVYGVPVVFGPKIQTSREAQELLKLGGAILLKDKFDTYKTLRKIFSEEEFRKKIGNVAAQYVHNKTGATRDIIKEVERYL